MNKMFTAVLREGAPCRAALHATGDVTGWRITVMLGSYEGQTETG